MTDSNMKVRQYPGFSGSDYKKIEIMANSETTYCITVKGKVQGVFFRASTKKEADKLHIKGIVKNMPNGEVYIELQGEADAIKDMKKWIQKGPKMARVDNIDIKIEKKEAFPSFEILR